MKLEVLEKRARAPKKGTMLFLHGASHAAWCWEHFMEWFSDHGYDCFALSFRGHGGSEGREHLDEFGFAEFSDDVKQTIDTLPEKPIVVAHSMGGMVLQRYLGEHADTVEQAVLLCAMPPDGTTTADQLKMLMRHFGPTMTMMKINSGKKLPANKAKNAIVFSGRLTADQVKPYVDLIQEGSKKVMKDQAKPATDNFNVGIPVHVIGSRGDWMFPDQSANAAKYGTTPIMLDNLCHDAMLDPEWEKAARAILSGLTHAIA